MQIKKPGLGKHIDSSFTRNKEYFEKFQYETLIKSWVSSGSLTLIDIGARNGESTNWFAKHFSVSVAHLFEPNPNIEINIDKSIQKVFIYRVAVSNVDTEKDFFIHEVNGMSSLEALNNKSIDSLKYANIAQISSIKVKTIRLDSINLQNIDIVKIDVQAHELLVLEGGRKTLSNAKVILIEVNLYDLYSSSSKIGKVEELLPNHLLFTIPSISYNPKNFRTDWVELFFVHQDLVQSII